ncbi:hypothetical protein BDV3_002500 [Batrachochytrium dendrobatidis]|uniref:CUE domain-containing protein n=1 Tax=Batrachochytrium dendrobatidis (strain JEL423) TaxID=403673 RepID=A0A177WW41_BATDL|nr:hypothetical protein QVD99_005805 [Batrachochytrium dendrobatidis]OAJ44269.1 hypothetical protein BDEG_27523 [Batrachochytrium dendrobatidis JEL423]
MADAKMIILETIFSDVDPSIIESTLTAHDGDLLETQAYLEKYFTSNKAAAAALGPRNQTFQESTMVDSIQINTLASHFPTIDPSVLKSVLDVFNNNMDEAYTYLEEKGHVMHYRKIAQTLTDQPESDLNVDTSQQIQSHDASTSSTSLETEPLPPYTSVSDILLKELSENPFSDPVLEPTFALTTAQESRTSIPPPLPPRTRHIDSSINQTQLAQQNIQLDCNNIANAHVQFSEFSNQPASAQTPVSPPRGIAAFSPSQISGWENTAW